MNLREEFNKQAFRIPTDGGQSDLLINYDQFEELMKQSTTYEQNVKQEEKELYDAVADINGAIFNEENDDYYFSLTITTDTFATNVMFLDQAIWQSENDEREYIEGKDEYEPIKLFLIKKMNEAVFKATDIIPALLKEVGNYLNKSLKE